MRVSFDCFVHCILWSLGFIAVIDCKIDERYSNASPIENRSQQIFVEKELVSLSQTQYAQSQKEKGNNMEDKNSCARWIHCPVCGGKTRTRVYFDTVMFKFPLYCPKCKKETKIDVLQFKMAESK